MSQDLEAKKQENLEGIKKFTLMDDTFMTQVFSGNIEAVELLLRIILKRDDLVVERVVTQFVIGNLFGKAVRLDIYARDAEGTQYNIEIQREDKGAAPERARMNSSMLDARLTERGEKDYKKIPETYVIFITENDILRAGLPAYSIERVVLQTQEMFGDNAHIVYVNGSYRGDDEIGNLMRDFHCTDYRDMKNQILADTVRYYKEDPEGVEKMCKVMDEIAERRAEERAEERAIEEKINIARSMIADGTVSLEKIAEFTNLSLETVKELASPKTA